VRSTLASILDMADSNASTGLMPPMHEGR
jgi:hypothetical protein